MRNKNKKILVTGGAGFIGSNLVKVLLRKNYQVIVYDDLSTGYKNNIKEFVGKIKFVKGDIRDFKKINNKLKNIDCVFHLAAMVSVPESLQKPIDCFDINIRASINIMKQCMQNNIKFIFASSAAVYGDDKTKIKTEKIKASPISPYGLSKLNIEELCKIYAKEFGLNYTCFRNFNVYGPKQDPNSAYAAVIPSFINNALNNKKLNIFGDGGQTRDFIYVEDVVKAYLLAYEKNISGIYNLGCNEILNLKKLAKLVLNISNKKINIIHKEARKGDIRHSRASSLKFQKISSWKPIVKVRDGIEKTVKYYINP